MKKPFFTDHCEHLSHGGVFVGSTVNRDRKLDIYIYPSTRGREVCIRYGNNAEEYASPYGSPEAWSDPKREVLDSRDNKVHLASEYDGAAMEMVRAFLDKERQ